MSLTDFWAHIDHQIQRLKTARTVNDVLAICPREPGTSSGDGFFAGSGGDHQVEDALSAAGWRHVWREADYYWVMISPDGSELLSYVEGDLYRGDQVRR